MGCVCVLGGGGEVAKATKTEDRRFIFSEELILMH